MASLRETVIGLIERHGGGHMTAAALVTELQHALAVAEIPPTIWIADSELDGYFVALFTSSAGDVEAARRRAWEVYTGPGNRPEIEDDGRPGWQPYHTDPRGLNIFELGAEYVGSDGQSHLEVDNGFDPNSIGETGAMRCEFRNPAGTRCTLPIGHGDGFEHDFRVR